MSQFNSLGQIVGLFMLATIVSIGLIFLINVEAQSRLDHSSAGSAIDDGSGSSSAASIRSVRQAASSNNIMFDNQKSSSSSNPTSSSSHQIGAVSEADTYHGVFNYFSPSAKQQQHNYSRQMPSPTSSPPPPPEEVETTLHTNRILNKENEEKTKTNFLTYFGSQIIKLFTSVNSNINLAHLTKFEDGDEVGESRRRRTNFAGSEIEEVEKSRKKRSVREVERKSSSTFSNVMDGNNNNNNSSGRDRNEMLAAMSSSNGFAAGGSVYNNNNMNSRNVNGGHYGSGVIGSTNSKPSTAAVTSDFHKIRHAMKKLENDGGLEGDVVLRMMLGPNAKIHESRSNQQQQQKSEQQQPVAHISFPTTKTTTVKNHQSNIDDKDDDEKLFINFQEKLTSLKNKNTIDWKLYAEDEDDDDDDDNDDDEEEENEDIDELSPTKEKTSAINWADDHNDDDGDDNGKNNIMKGDKNPGGSLPSDPTSSITFRAVIPGERKHNRNYYTDDHGNFQQNSLSASLDKLDINAINSIDDDSDLEYQIKDSNDYNDNILLQSTTLRTINGLNVNNNSSSSSTNTHFHNGTTVGHQNTKKSIIKENLDSICYNTDDVLIVIGITCCLNFAFVLIIWTCVKWFSINGVGSKEKQFRHLDCEDGLNEPVDFHQHDERAEDPYLWTSIKNCNSRKKGGRKKYNYSKGIINNGMSGRTTTSLYSFRPDPNNAVCTSSDLPPQSYSLRRSYSYSMEDLRFYNCT